MNTCVKRRNAAALFVLGALVVLSVIAYMTVELNFSNERLLRFAMKLRAPKLFAMLIAAIAIGGASKPSTKSPQVSLVVRLTGPTILFPPLALTQLVASSSNLVATSWS